MDPIKLGYWKVRGRAQVSRLLLAYTEADWVDVQYQQKEKWFQNDKINLQIPFPNLPYLIEGNYKITQHVAVQRYIIRRSKFRQLLGKNPQEEGMIDNVEELLMEIRTSLVVRTLWGNAKTWKQDKKQIFQGVRKKLEQIKEFIGEKQFALGHLSYLDFLIQEFSFYVEKIFPEEYANFPFLNRIRTNFNELPKIKAYYQRQDAVKGPFIAGQANLMF